MSFMMDLLDHGSLGSAFNAHSTTKEQQVTDPAGKVSLMLRALKKNESDLSDTLKNFDSLWSFAMVRAAFATEKTIGYEIKSAAYKTRVGDIAVTRLADDLSCDTSHALGRIQSVQAAFREMDMEFKLRHRDQATEALYTHFDAALRCGRNDLNDMMSEIDYAIERMDFGIKNPEELLPHVRIIRHGKAIEIVSPIL